MSKFKDKKIENKEVERTDKVLGKNDRRSGFSSAEPLIEIPSVEKFKERYKEAVDEAVLPSITPTYFASKEESIFSFGDQLIIGKLTQKKVLREGESLQIEKGTEMVIKKITKKKLTADVFAGEFESSGIEAKLDAFLDFGSSGVLLSFKEKGKILARVVNNPLRLKIHSDTVEDRSVNMA